MPRNEREQIRPDGYRQRARTIKMGKLLSHELRKVPVETIVQVRREDLKARILEKPLR